VNKIQKIFSSVFIRTESNKICGFFYTQKAIMKIIYKEVFNIFNKILIL